ncbi:MAG: DNA primase, partial [Polymorphobacter sp.]
AAAWFTEQLGSVEGAEARAYLVRRGIAPAVAQAFGLGLAPDSKSRLKSALASLGQAKLIDTGLLIAPEEAGREPYDRFRGRLMFPIRDPRGRVIGFGGRILGDGQPKYLNSPDTILFDKGRTLYNFDRAGPVARKSLRLLVVEGYMDVIALAQAGIAEAVAPLGTALTETQLALLWRVVPEPILCFDGDAAGQRAGLRAALRALPLLEPGRSLRFATLPAGQDPDDFVRSKGVAAFEALLAAAEPLIDLLWRTETTGVDTGTPERRAALRERLRLHSQAIANTSVRSLYDSEFRSRFDARFNPPRSFGRNGPAGRGGVVAGASPRLKALQARASGDAELAALLVGLLEHPALADRHGEALAQLSATEPGLEV